jgi:hypothetical protein
MGAGLMVLMVSENSEIQKIEKSKGRIDLVIKTDELQQ